MIRMLVARYVFAIRSERLICREVPVNRAYRWFCKLGIEDAIPDHSAFWRACNERFTAYSDNYLIGMKFDVIVDVEASRSIQAEVGAAKTMIERTEERFGIKPERLVGDTVQGAAPMLIGQFVAASIGGTRMPPCCYFWEAGFRDICAPVRQGDCPGWIQSQ